MPKINIYEKDYTSPGVTRYNNFAVLVPGFAKADAEGKYSSLFDDNDVAEFNDEKTFVSEIGLIGAEVIEEKPLVLPVILNPIQLYTKVTEAEQDTYTADEPIDGAAGIKKSQLNNKYVKTDENTYESAVTYFVGEEDETKIFSRAAKTEEDERGYLVDNDYKYTPVTTLDGAGANDKFYILSDRGQSYVKGSYGHYGNQIAYELLKLGFSILYKRISSISDVDLADTWTDLDDKGTYDFRYIVTGLRDNNQNANVQIATLARSRTDCTALLDIDERAYTSSINRYTSTALAKAIADSVNQVGSDTYSPFFGPSVKLGVEQLDAYNDNQVLPCSLYYLSCAISALKNNYPEHYAVAGYVRGTSSLSIISPVIKIGENLNNLLSPRVPTAIDSSTTVTKAVNLITKVKNNYYLWGNRTGEALTENGLVAKHYLNIRQLCTTLKKELYVDCKRLTFNPNSDKLWFDFCSLIRPTLESLKANQGIRDYRILRVDNKIKGRFDAIIRLIPIEAVEDFEITITLEDNFESTSVSVAD